MTRISIINGAENDDAVIKNGRVLRFDLSGFLDDPAIWAVQWNGASGEIEYTDRPPEPIESMDVFGAVLAEFDRLAAIEDTPEVLTVAQLARQKKAAINAAADAAIAPVSTKYPRSEIDSWPVQVAEAAAHTVSSAATTPFIDGLLVRRPGKTKAELVAKIQLNAAAYTVLSADVFGQRQALDDLVDAATTIAELDAITVAITGPG
ncbi:MAG: hypothetical protein AB9Q19_12540 [Candidatus Reddybacter sp.]